MSQIRDLYPRILWEYFIEICKIPRASKNEERIIQYLINFGKSQGLETKQDEAGNVLIKKPASPGKECLIPVVLQSHLDMVCEKLSDSKHDFDTDPIVPIIKGEWIKANGTTLGADDGIGIAAQMAILASEDIEHGPVECLFTVDEETGLTGAFALKEGFLEGEILINLDSEDEGELFIGCAGGIDTIAELSFTKESVPDNFSSFIIKIDGLNGGHSGDEIHKGLGNSIKILNRLLWDPELTFGIRISEFGGGKFRNAIPRDSFARILVPPEYADEYFKFFNFTKDSIKNELFKTEPDLKITIEKINCPDFVIDKSSHEKLLNALYACHHGVYEMSRSIKGMVETSSNLATVKFTDNIITITTNQRSSVTSAKIDISNTIKSVFSLAGAKVTQNNKYPGWNPRMESEILKISVNSYSNLFGEKPVVRSIHAGLECGLFLEKYPGLDMISFGPTIKGAHTPDERININTVEKFWNLLKDVLKNISDKK